MQGKSAIGSATICSAVVIAIVQIAQIAGYALSADDQVTLTNMVQSGIVAVGALVSLISSGVVIWRRLMPNKPITSLLPSSTPK